MSSCAKENERRPADGPPLSLYHLHAKTARLSCPAHPNAYLEVGNVLLQSNPPYDQAVAAVRATCVAACGDWAERPLGEILDRLLRERAITVRLLAYPAPFTPLDAEHPEIQEIWLPDARVTALVGPTRVTSGAQPSRWMRLEGHWVASDRTYPAGRLLQLAILTQSPVALRRLDQNSWHTLTGRATRLPPRQTPAPVVDAATHTDAIDATLWG